MAQGALLVGAAWLALGTAALAAESATPAATATVAPAAAPVRPPRISTADFATQPTVSGPVLSPDGHHLAARLSIAGKERLAIVDVFGKEPTEQISLSKDNDLVRYFWAGNGTLMIVAGKTVPWFDDEAYATRMTAFDLATRAMHAVDPHIGGLRGDDVLWVDPEGKTLLLAYQETVEDYPSVWRVDIAANKATKVSKQYPDIWDWYADASGVVRYGFGYTDDHNWQMVYRSKPDDKFKVVLKGNDDKDDDSNMEILRIEQGSDKGFTFDRDAKSGLWGVYEYDFGTRQRGALVYAAPANDIESVETSEDGQRLISASYTDDRNRVKWFDEKLATLQDQLDKAVGADRQAWVVSHSRDYGMLIVALSASFDPGSYYLYQQAEGVMHRLARVNEALKAGQMAPSTYVHYKARDGRDIAAYLTLPQGRAASGLPLIILPHGGPFDVRDEGGFDDDVQFLANRGYAVLQPQFRGSGSYGKAFDDAAKGQWGRAMQDDLDDGMDWLATRGTIDAKRVCMVGSSYGGYAALWAATRNPERYRCAASFAGISDVPKWLKYSGRFEGTHHRENWRAQLQGDKSFDLKTVSPLYTVDRLKVPVLLVHGDADTRVPPKQSKLYADALTAAGKPHEFYTIAGEGHGFTTAANEQLWLDKLDAFLAKYNPAD